LSVTDKDNGFAATLSALAQKPPSLETGIFGAAADLPHGDRGQTVGDVCNYMEHGTPTIPERPFISGWWDRHQEEAFQRLGYLMRAGVKAGNLSWDEAFRVWGAWCVKGIKAEMPETPPPLAASTIRKKGHATVLIDTALLQSSISYRMVKQ
jgi:hypothetical protein